MTEMANRYPNFTLAELLDSETAREQHIDNTPTFEVVDNLNELTSKILQPLRSAWGSAITVTSGYRCKVLNKAVGGSDTSAHMLGYAADLYPTNGKFEEFCRFTVKFLTDNRILYDQILIERSGWREWLHIGLYNNNHERRGIVKDINL